MTTIAITTQLDFCYAHRITQHGGKCAWLHGHNGLLEVTLASDSLNQLGMVADFVDIKEQAKKWIDNNFDHATILARFDPLVSVLQDHQQKLFVMDEEPSAENMLFVIERGFRQNGLSVQHLKLWETEKNAASITF